MTNTFTRATASFAATALVASGLAFATSTPANAAISECVAATDTVSVFGFNDFHGRIGAAAKLFTPVEEARATAGVDNVLLLSSGDNIGASLFESMIADDKPTLDILNAIGLDVSTVGNHEFDKGWADLSGRVAAGSDFSYLGANVYTAGTTTVAAPLKAYETFEKGGVTIAVVGAVTADTPSLVDPSGIAGLEFGDPVEAVNRVTAELLDGNAANGEADIVIASFHEGAANGSLTPAENAANSEAFDSIYNDVDPRVAAIFNAHTHQLYNWVTTGGVPVIQAASYGSPIAQLDLSVDSNADALCGTTVTMVTPPATAGTTPAITAINAIVTAANAFAAEEGQQVIGFADEAISTPTGNADKRDTESPMNNLVAQMFFEVLGDADADNFIGIQNPGGTRDSFNAGDITYREAALTLPFANSLFTTQITGAQFKTVLEQQWQRNTAGEVPSRPFLQLGLSDNVSYTYDESLPEGDRITSISINGQAIDMDKLYTAGGASFLIAGGDNFRELGEGINTADTGWADLEAWVTWVGTHESLSPDYSKRGVSAKLPATNTLVEGGAGLTFTFGLPLEGGVAQQTLDMYLEALVKDGVALPVSPDLANTEIVAFIGDVEVGSGTVTDGVATITVKLPAGTEAPAGAQVLTFVVLDSGTIIDFPVTVELKAKPEPTPTPNPNPGFTRTAPYTLPGEHNLNGRLWRTTCEPYSQTERCRTEIWASTIKIVDGKFVQTNGWAFNNLTYLPAKRSLWGNNPLANTGSWTATDGRQWKTECGTAATGRDGCRSYAMATVYKAVAGEKSGYVFSQSNEWVFNNIVMFAKN
ncbi:bifunctional UDP-sugar hydrolase/5'-nucleotidase [Tessaracoccus sp. MC1756]|uniref:bifunctional metallophosphatase/5'-nucleotidase n=1 Tax=Tessaracoccus sp. MC1756 TaxID=2760311 RepID=UPI0016002C3A|nr:bifunctional UDP-sugar hydrolase/5'-nucleotidase [Tessaracoccus sp. MC1756]MBB1510727.1 bifunctional metallophosphatase/5'-nucleotidase [Tessaracoccus sp. MC1756]